MISKNKIKYIKSLEKKKIRQELQLFIAEGNKLVESLFPYFECELLLAKPSWMATQGDLPTKELIVAEEGDIEKASLLKNPQDVIAVFNQSKNELDRSCFKKELTLVLDGIQDPGNLGTIIRVANWFGIRNIICSPDTADVYNPKVIQATMGAIAYVNVFYYPVFELMKEVIDENIPLYGTFLDGDNIYEKNLEAYGCIVMGNEGNGISSALEEYINHRLLIPNYPPDTVSTESLNVAAATAVICAEFRRQQIYSRK